MDTTIPALQSCRRELAKQIITCMHASLNPDRINIILSTNCCQVNCIYGTNKLLLQINNERRITLFDSGSK